MFRTIRLIQTSFTAELVRIDVTTGSNEIVNGTNAINPIRLLVFPVDEILIVARVFGKVVCFQCK